MTKTYKVTVLVAEGSGAGYGYPPHIYIQGLGVAFGNSPKKAVAHAWRLAELSKGESAVKQGLPRGTGLIPVYSQVTIEKNGTVISDVC